MPRIYIFNYCRLHLFLKSIMATTCYSYYKNISLLRFLCFLHIFTLQMNRTDYFLYASYRCIGLDHAFFVQAQFTKIPHNYHNSPIKQIRNSANPQFSKSAIKQFSKSATPTTPSTQHLKQHFSPLITKIYYLI